MYFRDFNTYSTHTHREISSFPLYNYFDTAWGYSAALSCWKNSYLALSLTLAHTLSLSHAPHPLLSSSYSLPPTLPPQSFLALSPSFTHFSSLSPSCHLSPLLHMCPLACALPGPDRCAKSCPCSLLPVPLLSCVLAPCPYTHFNQTQPYACLTI